MLDALFYKHILQLNESIYIEWFYHDLANNIG